MDVELIHLRTLAEIARLASFSRAADALHLSQPAVSHHVRHLEAALGVRVLDRLGKRAVPTRAGALVLERARRIFQELEAVGQELHRLRGVVSGRVRLGTGATASIYLLPPLLRRLRRDHPDLELVVVTGNAPEIAAGVLGSELDVGVVTLPVSERRLEVSPFCPDPLVAIAPADGPWRARGRVSPAELARHPLILYERGGMIRRVIDRWFRAAGVRPHVTMELGNAEAIKELVAAGLGLSITSAITVTPEVTRGALRALPLEPPLARELGVIRRRGKTVSPGLRVVLNELERFSGRPARGGSRGSLHAGELRGRGSPSRSTGSR
ncbi:MAG TPA: LysR family transcriptional regulator [Terriglobales bacterium]|nr:LysR family transcriptional regulator [Terriglobales bacterium]